jgi:putative flippase GtrA
MNTLELRVYLYVKISINLGNYLRNNVISSIEKLFKNQTDEISVQFLRYIFVGGFAFIVDFSSLFVLTEYLNIYYLLSAAIAFILGIIVNYSLSISWVFDKRTFNNKMFEFQVFAFIGVIGLVLNELFIWFFTNNISLYYLYSKLISAFFVLLWNFFARKLLLFR